MGAGGVRRLAAEAQASRAAVRHAKHHAVKPGGRQHSGSAAGAAAAAAPRGAAADQPPDDDENEQDVDKLYLVASAAQRLFNAWAQIEALHSRGGENIGGGFWRYAPKHFVQLGGASDTVGVWSRWWCTTRTGPTAASVACAPCTGGTARKTSARPAWPVRVKPSNARSVRARASNF